MTAVEQRVAAMRVAVIEGKSLTHILPRTGGLAAEDRGGPGGVTRLQAQAGIVKSLGDPEQFVDQLTARAFASPP